MSVFFLVGHIFSLLEESWTKEYSECCLGDPLGGKFNFWSGLLFYCQLKSIPKDQMSAA